MNLGKPLTANDLVSDMAGRAGAWLDALPLNDRWQVRAHTAIVTHVRTSAYVDEELHLADGTGANVPSGLSGDVIDARPGHRVTIVRLAARNSGRERAVVLFDHDNGKAQILDGNFAPLLRSRFEGVALVAGLTGATLSAAVGVWLMKVVPRHGRGHPAGPFFVLASMLMPLGIVFTGKRRKRLRRSLEDICRSAVEQLRTMGSLAATQICVTASADETPPPAA